MKKLLFALILLAFVPASLATADIKIAVIDLSKTFDQYYKTKDAQAKLKAKEESYSKEIQDLVTEYNHMGEEAQNLDKAAHDPTLSAAAQTEKAKAFDAKKQDLIAMSNKITDLKGQRGREIQEELLRRHKEIVDEITKVVTDYAGPAGYDLVVDKSSSSAASGVSIILYNSSKLFDITTDIISKLNATAPATSTAAATSASAPTPAPAH